MRKDLRNRVGESVGAYDMTTFRTPQIISNAILSGILQTISSEVKRFLILTYT